MLACALLNYADDEGYFNANEALIKGECFPLREPSVSIHGALTELSNIGYLRLGSDERGRRYGHIVNFLEHQKVNRPTASKIKALKIEWEDSVRTHGGLTEGSLPERKGTGKGKEEVRADARSSDYAFEGDVIRLSQSDFDKWTGAFSNLNLKAELLARDIWLANDASAEDRKRWFISTSKYLANRNAEAMAQASDAGTSSGKPARPDVDEKASAMMGYTIAKVQ